MKNLKERMRVFYGSPSHDYQQVIKQKVRRKIKLICVSLLVAFWTVNIANLFAQRGQFNGLNMSLGNLPRLSYAKTRSISPENFTGEKGKGGMATKGTGAGTGVPQDHDGGRPAFPAFTDIGTPGFLTHCMHLFVGYDFFQVLKIGAAVQSRLQPGGFAWSGHAF